LGITDHRFQSLYHFTVGGPVEDRRIQHREAYFHRRIDPAATCRQNGRHSGLDTPVDQAGRRARGKFTSTMKRVAQLAAKLKHALQLLWLVPLGIPGLTWAAPETQLIVPTEVPFSIQPRQGVAWLVRPDGTRFFSLGVCCVDQGTAREEYTPEKPGYASWQHYADSNQWAKATLNRLQSWGFTTIGGWSDFNTLQRVRNVPVTFAPVLHVGSTAGAPWWDMWDPGILDRMDQVAREQILAVRDDPRLLGYYSDNEMGWWNGALFRMTLDHVPASGQRRRLLDLLRQTYRNDWSELCRDFDPEGVSSFDELDQHGRLYLRGGSNGIRTLRRFLSLVAERYYALVHEIIRRYDRRALILGDRYQSFYYPEVAAAAAGHVDAISSNLNAGWNDGSFARYYLDTLHALTGKPVLASEFYMAARENRSGNENKPGFPVVNTQGERVAGFRRTLETLLQTPYVIGADWFQYYDEPTFGRADGENYNFGLVDIHDRPYETLVLSAALTDCATIKASHHPRRLDASDGVPRAPRDPFERFEPHLALRGWDRERGYVQPTSRFPLGDLYVCWSPQTLYLGVYAQDVVEPGFYRDQQVPDLDRAEWTVRVGKRLRTIRARLGAGAPAVVDDPAVRIVHLSGVELNTRCIAAMAIPASRFGRSALRPGDRVEFDSTFYTHCRAYRTDWRGTFALRSSP
jgi:hypothetical protein